MNEPKPKPSTAPAFVSVLYPLMVKAAKRCHYALAVHGSMIRDFDLIAVPWDIEACAPDELARVIADSFGGSIPPMIDTGGGHIVPNPEPKPHGRIGYTIRIGHCDQYIDLSITPRNPAVYEPLLH